MQVTQLMPQTVLLSSLDSLMTSIMGGEQQVATGSAIQVPSDNPSGTAEDLNISQAQAWNAQWTRNATTASSYMSTTNQALSQLNGALQSAANIASAGSSATENVSEMQAQASQVGQLIQEIQQLANTQYAGQYVFGGVSGSAPWNVQTGQWNLTAAATPVAFEVGSGVSIPAGVDGFALFQGPVGGGTAGGILSANGATTPGILETLQSDLASGNSVAVGADLKAVSNAIAYVSAQQAQLGAQMQRVGAASAGLQQVSVQLAQDLAQVASTNMPAAIAQLTNQETVYQAALDVGAKMILPTLATLMP